jgi:uncharacterized protein
VSFDLIDLFPNLLTLSSLALWAWILLRWRKGEPPLAYRDRPDASLDVFTVLAVLFLWLMVPPCVHQFMQPTVAPSLHNVRLSCVSGVLTLLGFMATLFAASGYRPHELGIGLKQWADDLRDGGVGYLAAFLPVFLVLLATKPLRSEPTMHPFLKVLQKYPQTSTVLWMILVAVVIAPLLEELLFRVVLQGALTKRVGPKWSIPLVAVAFSAVHSWPDSLALIPLALVLGYVYHRRHSYLAVVVLHAIFNATNLVFALLSAENAPAGS